MSPFNFVNVQTKGIIMNKLISLVQMEIALKRAGITVTEEQLETLKQSLFTPQVGEK